MQYKHLQKLSEAIKEGHRKTRKDALQESLQILEKIATLWILNVNLEKPLDHEELTKLTQDAILELKEKISEGKSHESEYSATN